MDFAIHSLSDALQLPIESSVTVNVQILQIDDVQEYVNREKQKRRYYTALVADDSTSCKIRSYAMKAHTSFAPGRSLLLQGILRKSGEQPLWVVSSSKIIDCAPVNVPEKVKEAAESQSTSTGDTVELERAITLSTPCRVTGKIVETSPLKHLRSGDLPTKFLLLRDRASGPSVKVALFGEEAHRQYDPGEVVAITEAYRWKDSNKLSTKRSTKIEFLPPDSLSFSIADVSPTDDEDFKLIEEKEPEQISVLGIENASTYQCCGNAGCRNKKLNDAGKCPTCNKSSLAFPAYYCHATLAILKEDRKLTTIKLFQDELEKLFSIPDLPCANFKEMLTKQLPINGKGKFTNNGLKVINSKRKC